MSAGYEPGDTVLIRAQVVEYVEGVGACVELFSKTDQYRAWVRTDLIAPRGAIVLDLEDTYGCWAEPRDPRTIAAYLRETNSVAARSIADQIEAQTKPPRIPEPGLWGVVEATGPTLPRRRWVHHEEDRWVCDTGLCAYWDDLIDPALIREGVQS